MKQADLGLNENQLVEHQAWLKSQTDRVIADFDFLNLLKPAGIPAVFGSYVLDVMVWPDIDIEVACPDKPDIDKAMKVINTLVRTPDIIKVDIRNQLTQFQPGGYSRFFIGLQLIHQDIRWQVDINFVSKEVADQTTNRVQQLLGRLNDQNRKIILTLKQKAAASNNYHVMVTSMDLYTAVLDEGIVDIDSFNQYLQRTGRSL